MRLAKWVVNAVRGRAVERPRPGQVVRPMEIDRWRDYPADGLTPAQLAAILRAADEGAVEQAMALFEQMEEKDAHLHCVAATRRLAVPPMWKVRIVNWVPGSPIDWAAMIPIASPTLTSLPRARSLP